MRCSVASTRGVSGAMAIGGPAESGDLPSVASTSSRGSINYNSAINPTARPIHSARIPQTRTVSTRLPVSSIALVGDSADRSNSMRLEFAPTNTTAAISNVSSSHDALHQPDSSVADTWSSNHGTVPDSSTQHTTSVALPLLARASLPADSSTKSLINDIHHTSFALHPSQHARFGEHLFQLQSSAAQSLSFAQQHSLEHDAALSRLRAAHAEEFAALQTKLAEISADFDGDVALTTDETVLVTECAFRSVIFNTFNLFRFNMGTLLMIVSHVHVFFIVPVLDSELQQVNTTLALLESSRQRQADTANLHIPHPIPYAHLFSPPSLKSNHIHTHTHTHTHTH